MNLSKLPIDLASQFEDEFNLNQPLEIEDVVPSYAPEKNTKKSESNKQTSQALAEVFITREISDNTLWTEADILNFFNTQVNQQEKIKKLKNTPLSATKTTLKALKNLKKDPTIATGDLVGIALFLQNFDNTLDKYFSEVKNKSQRNKNISEILKELNNMEETLHTLTNNSDQGTTIKNSIYNIWHNHFEWIGAIHHHKQTLENLIA